MPNHCIVSLGTDADAAAEADWLAGWLTRQSVAPLMSASRNPSPKPSRRPASVVLVIGPGPGRLDTRW